MYLFFLLLGIVVLGVTFVVASGSGAGMAAPERDARPLGIPPEEEGPLRAEHLASLRLPGAVRGYRMDVVDALLDRLQRQLQVSEASGSAEPAGPAPVAASTADLPPLPDVASSATTSTTSSGPSAPSPAGRDPE